MQIYLPIAEVSVDGLLLFGIGSMVGLLSGMFGVGGGFILTPLLGSLYALDNLYNNPEFAKDDLRALVAYVEQRAGERDVVLYNNAVLLPLHAHYQQRDDLPVTAPSPLRPLRPR